MASFANPDVIYYPNPTGNVQILGDMVMYAPKGGNILQTIATENRVVGGSGVGTYENYTGRFLVPVTPVVISVQGSGNPVFNSESF
jgi:hypothetical protein